MNPLRINLSEGSVALNFAFEPATRLKKEIDKLMVALKSNASNPQAKPTPQPSLEYQYSGDIFLEVFCNPNIYGSPFAAKVLLTIRDEKIRLTTEAELTRFVEDLDLFLEQA